MHFPLLNCIEFRAIFPLHDFNCRDFSPIQYLKTRVDSYVSEGKKNYSYRKMGVRTWSILLGRNQLATISCYIKRKNINNTYLSVKKRSGNFAGIDTPVLSVFPASTSVFIWHNINNSQTWWLIPVITWGTEAGELLCVWGQPRVHSEFQSSLGCRGRTCLKQTKNTICINDNCLNIFHRIGPNLFKYHVVFYHYHHCRHHHHHHLHHHTRVILQLLSTKDENMAFTLKF